MATYNGNNQYLEIDSVDVSGYYTDQLSYNPSNNTVDTTAGAGITGHQRAAGLNDRTLSFVVVYDDATLATYVQKLKVGSVYTVVYGPEGNGAGKPKFAGKMILESVTQQASVEKIKVVFELEFQQADVPTHTIEGGDTF